MSLQDIFLNKKILQGGGWLFIERLVFILKGFVLSLFFANLLPKEVFGTYQFVLSLVGTACVFALPGMATAIIQAVARKQGGTFREGILLMFRYAFLGCLFLLGSGVYVAVEDRFTFSTFIFLIPLFPFYAVTIGGWRTYLTGKERFGQAARIGIGGELLSLFGMGLAVYFFSNISVIVVTSLLVPTLYYGYFLLRSFVEASNEPVDISNLEFGKNLSWLYGAGVAASYFDRLAIGHFLGFTELAVFAIASIIPDQIRDSVRVLVNFVLPGFSRMEDTSGNRRIILKGIFFLFWLVAVGVGLYIWLAPYLFQWFFPAYTEAVIYTRFAALASLTVPFMILDSYFRGKKDNKTATKVALSGYVAGTAANIILIPFLGIWGAVIARALSLSVNALLFFIAFLRRGIS